MCWVSWVLMRLASRVISPRAGETGSPKAIYSFNGLLMRFVLHLPVSSDVPLDSDEAELFIWGSCSRRRRAAVHLQAAAPPSLMWNFFSLGRKVRDFSPEPSNHAMLHADLLSVTGCGYASHLCIEPAPWGAFLQKCFFRFYVSSQYPLVSSHHNVVSRIKHTILFVMSQGAQILSQYRR